MEMVMAERGAALVRQAADAQLFAISCLPNEPSSSNGSDMALFRAGRPSAPPRVEGSATGAGAGRGAALTDPEVCRALASGEAWAAEVVYDRIEDVVDGVLFRLLGPGDLERDDLAQQALERVITSIVQGRFSNGCSLRSWATLVTQNLAIDTMRARSRERKVFDRGAGHQMLELVAEEGRTPERLAETRRRVERLLPRSSPSTAGAPRPSSFTTSWAMTSRRSRPSRA
jgi:DNA-directed RNA polymerase specialized sigma24 family protein